MIEEIGTVVQVNNQDVWVETVRRSACQGCRARSGCGQAVMGDLLDQSRQEQKNVLKMAHGSVGPLVVGDDVIVGIPEQALIRLACLAYGVPVLSVLVFGGVAQWFGWPDIGVVFASALGLVAAIVSVKKISLHLSCDFRYQPVLIAKRIASVKLG
ncbi:SoxR reducing system RseC family protein [Gynuella sunshinyii]|uniref:Positive regulator of sigma E activity n=1 Tax=Gynuella sunshinyii YC6258 TaxID=1445510 RepID=A0A0C5V4X8_9GAMM|nr:SoxR reducing system RseC family protein [Gynuella sunshinyii]AJQ94535.1 positive regulator of sigma E activity [Gynuella sunshinyii YC6258]